MNLVTTGLTKMNSENKAEANKNFSLDWLVGGVLTKLGDTFDRFTGRGWNPSSSLATSKLTEKLKFLLDSEVKDLGKDGKFVPHLIKLKIQWDKFSTDAEEDLDGLKYELQAAAIDHINDKLYHTYAPLDIEIKTDYFTDGVRMLASFGKFSENGEDVEAAVNVTVPNLKMDGLLTDNKITVNLSEEKIQFEDDIFTARFETKGRSKETKLDFTANKRISVGRSAENALTIDDQSVSKIHAALVLGKEKQLMVADTGSTNGTFINGQRIAYGKASAFDDDAKIRFGTVEVAFERISGTPLEDEISAEAEEFVPETEANLPPTVASNNEMQVISEIKPTEANISVEKAELHNIKSENMNMLPTEADIKISENAENTENFETIANEEKSELINIDKTQDREI